MEVTGSQTDGVVAEGLAAASTDGRLEERHSLGDRHARMYVWATMIVAWRGPQGCSQYCSRYCTYNCVVYENRTQHNSSLSRVLGGRTCVP